MTFSTIIFDLGGIVTNRSWHDDNKKKFDEFSEKFSITMEGMDKAWEKFKHDFVQGKISEEVFWEKFLKEAGMKNVEEDNIEEAELLWREYQKVNDGMLALISRLRKKYKVVAITNIPLEWFEYKNEEFEFDEHFDEIVVSGAEKVSKPNPKIFQILLKRLNVKAEECIMVDDRDENIATAKQLGMKSIKFVSQKQLEGDFRKEGVKL